MTVRTASAFPVSMIRERAREYEREQLMGIPGNLIPDREIMLKIADSLGWEDVLEEFEFPEVYAWGQGEAPTEVMEQLIGQYITFGMNVTYGGQECLVVDLDITPQEFGKVMTSDDLDAYWRPLTIIPIKYLDFSR